MDHPKQPNPTIQFNIQRHLPYVETTSFMDPPIQDVDEKFFELPLKINKLCGIITKTTYLSVANIISVTHLQTILFIGVMHQKNIERLRSNSSVIGDTNVEY